MSEATEAALVLTTSAVSTDVNNGASLSANESNAKSCKFETHVGYSSKSYERMSSKPGCVAALMDGNASISGPVSMVSPRLVSPVSRIWCANSWDCVSQLVLASCLGWGSVSGCGGASSRSVAKIGQ